MEFNTYKNCKLKRVYGLTGGIATGKSFVSGIFLKLGADVIDADFLAREVVKMGSPILEKISKTFGNKILNSNGTLNRSLLRKIIINDNEDRKKLNEIIHPAIIKLENDFVDKSKKNIIIVDAALLIESGSYKRFEKIILVYTKRETQIERLIKRDSISKEEAENTLKIQIPIDEKRKFANFIIDNSGSKSDTEKQVVLTYELL